MELTLRGGNALTHKLYAQFPALRKFFLSEDAFLNTKFTELIP